MMSLAALSAPWEVLVVCVLLLVAPVVAVEWRRSAWTLGGLVVVLAATLFLSNGPLAYGAAAAGALLHAVGAWPTSRTGALWLVVTALITGAAGLALGAGQLTAAFVLSTVAIAIRGGVLPLNAGVASLCDRAPVVQTQQLASMIALVFVHLRFVDHHPEAMALAPTVVHIGTVAAVSGALLSIAQRDLRGFYRATTSVHGGMILAALGAASHYNFAAALIVVVSTGLSLGGLGIVITSLEERVGAVRFDDGGGRIQAFSRMGAAFVLFGGAGVAMPGTVGFVADDLLLHTLWRESPTGTVLLILASATLAVSTLICYSHVFLGRAAAMRAPDLSARERAVALVLLILNLGLGLAPGVLIHPADEFLTVAPALAQSVP